MPNLMLATWLWTGLLSKKHFATFLSANGLSHHQSILTSRRNLPVGRAYRHFNSDYMNVEIIETGLERDGRKAAAWWPRPRASFHMLDESGAIELSGDLLDTDEVVCDLCNAEVLIRPVPVVATDALCAECFASLSLPFPSLIRPYIPTALLPTNPQWVAQEQDALMTICGLWEQFLAQVAHNGQSLQVQLFTDYYGWLQGEQGTQVTEFCTCDVERVLSFQEPQRSPKCQSTQ